MKRDEKSIRSLKVINNDFYFEHIKSSVEFFLEYVKKQYGQQIKFNYVSSVNFSWSTTRRTFNTWCASSAARKSTR